jgi:hypothetical protein
MAMNYEPLTFVWSVCLIMAVAAYYMGAGKKSLIPLGVALGYTFMWVFCALLVVFFG